MPALAYTDRSRGHVLLTSLTLYLLPGPASGFLGSGRELLVGTRLAAHLCKPVAAEVLAELAAREGL